MEKEKEATDGKKRSKKRAVIFASVVLSLFVVLSIATAIDWDSLFSKEDRDRDSWVHYYDDRYFTVPDFTADITEDAEYMTQYDSVPRFTVGNERTQLEDVLPVYKLPCSLLSDYFALVKRGDYEKYYTLFTESYEKTHGDINFFTKRPLIFTMQKLYDIEVTFMKSELPKDGALSGYAVYYFNVSYRIKDNDGTFRRDIRSDESNTLLFEIVEKDGKAAINDIFFYKPAKNK
jgi:hypothetical protein